MKHEHRISNIFDLPSSEELEKYLETNIFDGMRINISHFKEPKDFLSSLVYKNIIEDIVMKHNNKVSTLAITYAFCKYYFDKGIPDEPWYSYSKGKTQYMPNLESPDLLVRYWFNYFSEIFYFRSFSIWDSIVLLFNNYYQFKHIEETGFKINVIKSLKRENPNIYKILYDIHKSETYSKANAYRNRVVHGINALDDIHSILSIEPRIENNTYVDFEGNSVEKKEKVIMSMGIGEYTTVRELLLNMEGFSIFTSEKIEELMFIMCKDVFVFKPS